MAFEQRPNNGALFPNKTKAKPSSPDYSGDLLIDVKSLIVEGGVAKVRIAGWKKSNASGSSFLSLAISNPQEQRQAEPERAKPTYTATSVADMDDDIPF